MITFSEIMNQFEFTNNETKWKMLKQAYQEKDVIPFVGAGMSVPAYPLWGNALRKLLSGTKREQKRLERYLSANKYEKAAAYVYKTVEPNVFLRRLDTEFHESKIEGNESKMSVGILPQVFTTGTILTTNFESAIEYFYEEQGNEIKNRVILSNVKKTSADVENALKGKTHSLLKIHGDIGAKETLVFTQKQYKSVYNDQEFVNGIRDLYSGGKHFLFLGCSCSGCDRYASIFRNVVKATKGKKTVLNFAFLQADEKPDSMSQDEYEILLAKRERELGQWGITPIWYPYEDKLHESVKVLLKELLDKPVDGPVGYFINNASKAGEKILHIDLETLRQLLGVSNSYVNNMETTTRNRGIIEAADRVMNALDDSLVVLIQGETGVRKTMFLNDLTDQGLPIIASYSFRCKREKSIVKCISEIAYQLAEKVPGYLQALDEEYTQRGNSLGEETERLDVLLDPIKRIKWKNHSIIAIDAIDVSDKCAQLINWISKQGHSMPKQVHFLLTCKEKSEVGKKLQKIKNVSVIPFTDYQDYNLLGIYKQRKEQFLNLMEEQSIIKETEVVDFLMMLYVSSVIPKLTMRNLMGWDEETLQLLLSSFPEAIDSANENLSIKDCSYIEEILDEKENHLLEKGERSLAEKCFNYFHSGCTEDLFVVRNLSRLLRQTGLSDAYNELKNNIKYVTQLHELGIKMGNDSEYHIAKDIFEELILLQNGKKEPNDLSFVAEVYVELAMLQTRMGYKRQSERSYGEAQRLLKMLKGNNIENNLSYGIATIAIYNNQGNEYKRHYDKKEKAIECYNMALLACSHLMNTYGRDVSEPLEAVVVNNLGTYYYEREEFSDAEKNLKRAYYVFDDLCLRVNKNFYNPFLAMCCENLGLLYSKYTRPKEDSNEYFNKSIEIYRKTVEETPASEYYISKLAGVLCNYGVLLKDNNNCSLAIECYSESLRLWESLVSKEHGDIYYRDLLRIYLNMGNCYHAEKKNNEAKELLVKALSLSKKLAEENGSLYLPVYALNCTNTGEFYRATGNKEEAIVLLRKAIEAYEKLIRIDKSSYYDKLASAYFNMALICGESQNLEENRNTLDLFKKAIVIRSELYKKYPQVYRGSLANIYNGFGNYYLQLGDSSEAYRQYMNAYNILYAQGETLREDWIFYAGMVTGNIGKVLLSYGDDSTEGAEKYLLMSYELYLNQIKKGNVKQYGEKFKSICDCLVIYYQRKKEYSKSRLFDREAQKYGKY